jgi:hypothetical protein
MSICRGAQCTRGGAYTMAPRWHRVWRERGEYLAYTDAMADYRKEFGESQGSFTVEVSKIS